MRSRTLALFVVLGLFAAGLLLFRGGDEPVTVLVPRGASLAAVAEGLKRDGVVTNSLILKVLLRLTGGTSRVRAGEFEFEKGMGAGRVLTTLYFGTPILHRVTIPEGWTVKLIAKVLAAEQLVNEEKFLAYALSKAAAQKYKLNTPHLEGFLFPETYALSRVDGEERIVDTMVQQFFLHCPDSMRAEAKAMGLTLEQFVTLASIVEKETGGSDERETVASVFHNRLKKHMRLQSDPTTIYGVQNFDGNLRKKDLERPSEYNTYTIPGLPPGPIASPGERTLKATLKPANTNYLYFVANNKGGHVFSESYEQHDRMVDLYQRGGRKKTQVTTTEVRKPNAIRKPAAAKGKRPKRR